MYCIRASPRASSAKERRQKYSQWSTSSFRGRNERVVSSRSRSSRIAPAFTVRRSVSLTIFRSLDISTDFLALLFFYFIYFFHQLFFFCFCHDESKLPRDLSPGVPRYRFNRMSTIFNAPLCSLLLAVFSQDLASRGGSRGYAATTFRAGPR